MMITASDIIDTMLSMQNEQQRQVLMRFFKTAPGEYGEGDQFLGLKVPQTRQIVKEARHQVPLDEIKKLLYSPWHEVRLCALLLLAEEMNAALPKSKASKKSSVGAETDHAKAPRRDEIAHFYLLHARQANNWDLVDLSCGYILGQWLLYPSADGALPDRHILDQLAASPNLWEQRIAIVTTSMLIRHHQYDDTLRIATTLLTHPHDLIHKAIGWMLREVGKRDIELLRTYLTHHHTRMPRTALRYAIERLSADERVGWMRK